MNDIRLTAKQMQAIDHYAIDILGVSSQVLMENAGRLVAEQYLKTKLAKQHKSVLVVCGTGHNGGDGCVAARHLLQAGCFVELVILGDQGKIKSDTKTYLDLFIRAGGHVIDFDDLEEKTQKTDMIVDALFGIGLNRALQGEYKKTIRIINESQAHILSIDTPSGLDVTTGKIYGSCVKADHTVTFSFMKTGFFLDQGPLHCGKISVVDIGIPKEAMEQLNI